MEILNQKDYAIIWDALYGRRAQNGRVGNDDQYRGINATLKKIEKMQDQQLDKLEKHQNKQIANIK